MPTLLNNGPCLCLELLENRCLLSADIVLAEPIVVTGTDAHDVITLTRLHNGLLEVAIQSFHDPEWTLPTDEPMLRFETPLGYGELIYGVTPAIYPGFRSFRATTGTIQIEAGAGNDRINVVDMFGQPYFVSGTHRTDDLWSGTPEGALRVPWYDEADGPWLHAHDVWTQEIKESYRGTMIEGVDMAEGATVGVRFNAAPPRNWIEFEPIIEPLPGVADENFDVPADEPTSEQFLDAAGLDLLIGQDMDGDWATEFDPWLDEATGPEWTDEAGLSDLWVEWTDDLPIDEWNSESDFFNEGSDGMMSDEMDE